MNWNECRKITLIRKAAKPTTDWCAAVVPVLKPNGQVSIWVDLKALNKAVEREHLVLPTLEDKAPNLAGSQIISSFDAETGFWEIPLRSKSQELTAFPVPYAKYCFHKI